MKSDREPASKRLPTLAGVAGLGSALALGLLGGGLPMVLPRENVWPALRPILLVVALLLALLTLLARQSAPLAVARGAALTWAVILTTSLMEFSARLLQLDFQGEETAWRRYPPYYREPRTPTGTVFYRRDGPDRWTGPPIRTWLRLSDQPAQDAYRDEPSFTVRYDASGFREQPWTNDWDMVVVGDSFVELGCLTDEQLYTSRMGAALGKRVRNLGVSNTGPLTHLHYLSEDGLRPSLREVVFVFYEGNDLTDLEGEVRAEAFHRSTGKRGQRTFHRQHSPLGALRDWILRPPPPVPPENVEQSTYLFPTGQDSLRVTLAAFAPATDSLSPTQVNGWKDFLKRWEDFAGRHSLELTLAFMPCKARILHGLVTPEQPAQPLETWLPSSLPAWVKQSLAGSRIRFVDLTPALREAAESGVCPYNPMIETHLNARGSEIVAATLVRHFSARP